MGHVTDERITLWGQKVKRQGYGGYSCSATGSAWQQTGSAFALLCHNVAPPLLVE